MLARSTPLATLIPSLVAALAGTAAAVPPPPPPCVFDLSTLNGCNGFVMKGIDTGDFSGASVSSGGDVNGDGIDDLIIGARGGDPNGQGAAGESYVVFGKSASFAASLNLSTLDGTNGFVINGIDAVDNSGVSVSRGGDVNGDGIDDLIIGAWTADPDGKSAAGESYVVFGKATPFAASLNLSTLDGTNGFVINGISAGDQSGFSVSSAGDVNGDGIDDLIIGAHRASPNDQGLAGETYLVFGKDTAVDGTFDAFLDLSTLDGTNGFAINGINIGSSNGSSVSSAGDVNGDGIGDVLIGAHLADVQQQADVGKSYVVFGRNTAKDGPFASSLDLSALDGTNGFVMIGVDVRDRFGRSVSSAGDVNGDDIDDIIIGAYLADPNGQSDAGTSYVVFGRSTPFAASLDPSTLNGTNGFVLNGTKAGDRSGTSVSSAGDVNDDGIDDLIIGAWSADPNGQSGAGESYVVFGKAAPFAASLDLSTLNGTNGFVINGIDVSDRSGYSVSSAGDVNGDGIGDLIIGAPHASPNGQSAVGESYVVFGRDRTDCPCIGDANTDGFTNAADFVILAGNFGAAVPPDTGGDLNSDGAVNAADFVILAGDFGCTGQP